MNILQKTTLQTLKKNRTRTVVTIIGIILSVSLFTAVTTSVSSLQNYLLRVVVDQTGSWNVRIDGLDSSDLSALKSDDQVAKTAVIQNLGYAKAKGIQNEDKPYLFIGAVDSRITDLLPIHVTEGRMPKGSGEILIPNHLQSNGGVTLHIGDVLTLSVGDRMMDGKLLGQNDAFQKGSETFAPRENRTYTVVGFYTRPSFEGYGAPGYTALTIADGTGAESFDAFITLRDLRNVYSFIDGHNVGTLRSVNNDLLRFSGISNDSSFLSVLYSLVAILIVIVMFGSICLIYNSFSISVAERTRQFGLLKSVGATKKQILRSVLFEALFLCTIGIPAGVLLGVAGIGTTLALSKDLLGSIMRSETSAVFYLFISWQSLAFACVFGLLTVLISAYIPAKRAVRISAIEGIRQTGDIVIRAKKVRTSRLVYALFGFEGMIASKNFKRNRRKYRATVISLFMSVVLFISASSLCDYLTSSMKAIVEEEHYDLVYTLAQRDMKKIAPDSLFSELKTADGVDAAGYSYSNYYFMNLPKSSLNPDYLKYLSSNGKNASLSGEAKPDETSVGIQLCFIDDASYLDFLNANHLDAAAYTDPENPKAVAYDFTKIYNSEEGRYYTYHLLNGSACAGTFDYIRESMEGYVYNGTEEDPSTGKTAYYIYINDQDQILKNTPEEAVVTIPLSIASYAQTVPFCLQIGYQGGMTLLYPVSAMKSVIGQEKSEVPITFYFKAAAHQKAYAAIAQSLQDKTLNTSQLYNYAESAEANRALVVVINIFAYGFIVLISLIAVANVFNTISTNIHLRRREFAMLKSVGMTRKGFNKMMNFECLLYGIKGLIYGIPTAIAVTYLIYRSILNGWETAFYIPWYSVVISIGSVFAVVFATMIYSMRKIKKDNPIDALKNENL